MKSYDATTGFPAKWHLRNERRNSILMTYPPLPILGWCFWLVVPRRKLASANQKQYSVLCGDSSSVWNFCAFSSDVISRGKQCWGREMSAVFSQPTIMDKSLGTVVQFERFLTHAKLYPRATNTVRPCPLPPLHRQCWDCQGTIHLIFQHCIGWGGGREHGFVKW